jgi:citrate lyase beta subunit
MAQFQQKQTSQARATLEAGRQFAADNLEGHKVVNWNDKIIANALMKQAAALIDSAPQP